VRRQRQIERKWQPEIEVTIDAIAHMRSQGRGKLLESYGDVRRFKLLYLYCSYCIHRQSLMNDFARSGL
jgi:hypothetical protein